MDGLSFYDAWETAGPPAPGHTRSNSNPWTAPLLWPDRRIDYIFSATPRPGGAGHSLHTALLGTHPVNKHLPLRPIRPACNPASATDHVSRRAWRLDEVQAMDD